MIIRTAKPDEIDEIMEVYRKAKAFMLSTGNKSQWINGYPQKELIEEDIRLGQCIVCEENGIHGVFAFIIGDDPTYNVIEDGAWLNDSPYGTIHRIGSDGVCHGILRNGVAYCREIIDNLRIDTHEDNKVMQHLVVKNGFRRCGIIHIADGSPRIAYHYVKEEASPED